MPDLKTPISLTARTPLAAYWGARQNGAT